MFVCALFLFLVVVLFAAFYAWKSDDDSLDDLYKFQQDFLEKYPSAKCFKGSKTRDSLLFASLFIFVLAIAIAIIYSVNELEIHKKSALGTDYLFFFALLFPVSFSIGYLGQCVYASVRNPLYRLIATKEKLLMYRGNEILVVSWREIDTVRYEPDSISIKFRDRSKIPVYLEARKLKGSFSNILELFREKGIKMYRTKKSKL